MATALSPRLRVHVDGKCFRIGEEKFFVKGVAYGPFEPNAAGQPFASPEQTAADFDQIRSLGANLVRIYNIPGQWFLDLAEQRGIKVFIDVPWNRHLCFLESSIERRHAHEAVRRAVLSVGSHPAVFALSVVSEIPADIARWSGARALTRFIDDLIDEARSLESGCLYTFGNYPSTEYLHPSLPDFACFNVYLHDRAAFRNYLARLQVNIEDRPLLLGECGVDALREGQPRQREILSWQIEEAFHEGVAGAVVFGFTDDWWRGGRRVEDWQMGITTRERHPKEAFDAVRAGFGAAPFKPLLRYPKVSIVVACHNGEGTLGSCLDSLRALRYPDCEILLVDDGSTDKTWQIALAQPRVQCQRFEANRGLSNARNAGIAAATGEIIAFTDADCRVDEDWLYYLVAALLDGDYAAMGGPNLLPLEDSSIATAVMASPGGPAHVLRTDREAEHIPGCNMAFFKWVFDKVGGFDPVFRQAGDDVDICWRLEDAGCRIGFCPSAFVWHHRRSTVKAYLDQQRGYGRAEALLARKFPERFNFLGGALWHGRIYAPTTSDILPGRQWIYRGPFAGAGYQSAHWPRTFLAARICVSLEYHVFVLFPLWILTGLFHQWLPLAILALLLPLAVCVLAGARVALPRRNGSWWLRPLVSLLCLLQPIVRSWARWRWRWRVKPAKATFESLALTYSETSLSEIQYWAQPRIERLDWVAAIQRRLEEQGRPYQTDTGWSNYDLEVFGPGWSAVQVVTVAEEHGGEKQTLRCALRRRWPFQARAVVVALMGLMLVASVIAARGHGWLFLIWVAPPILFWRLYQKGRELQGQVAALLDDLAKIKGLKRIRTETPEA